MYVKSTVFENLNRYIRHSNILWYQGPTEYAEITLLFVLKVYILLLKLIFFKFMFYFRLHEQHTIRIHVIVIPLTSHFQQ